MTRQDCVLCIVAFIGGFGVLADWPITLVCLALIGAVLIGFVKYEESRE